MNVSKTKETNEIYDDKTLRDIETFRNWLAQTPNGGMVFFGGAGVSTESGIPDFRSPDGLYAQMYKYPPETMISRSFFDAQPKDFYDFYFNRMITLDAKPNQAHLKLAELEKAEILSTVITQNIDGLHQKAGSVNVLELHGSVLRNYCMSCNAAYTIESMLEAHKGSNDGIPRCKECGDIIKPDVVLYEESLDQQVLRAAISAISQAELLVVAGTSLAVYPAAGLLDYFSGEHLVIINRTPTPQDHSADLCISANVGDVFDF